MDIFARTGQKLADHLNNVERKCGGLLGIAHDIGKVSYRFQDKLKGGKKEFRHALASLPIADYLFKKRGDDEETGLIKLMVIYYHHNTINYDMLQNDLIDLSDNSEKCVLTKEDIENAFELMKADLSEFLTKEISYDEFAKECVEKGGYRKDNELYGGECTEKGYLNWIKEILEKFYNFSSNMDRERKSKIAEFYSKLIEADWEDSGNEIAIPDWKGSIKEFENQFASLVSKRTANPLSKIKNDVQKRIWESDEDRILLVAPTGSGKTEASLKWALKKAYEKSAERIIYVLPFKVLIDDLNERFRNYLGADKVDVWHSDYLTDELLKTKEFSKFDSLDNFNFYVVSRKYFLKKPIVLTTADQVLMSFLNVSRYPIRMGLFKKSIFVFDEMQGYGELMRGLIYEFIKTLELPYMLMTATPPSELPKEIGLKVIKDDNWLENFHRNCNAEIEFTPFKTAKIPNKIFEELDKNIKKEEFKKIAVILNTIHKAKEVYKSARKKFSGDYEVLLLHSIMTQDDRKERLEKILNGSSKKIMVVSTQVFEAGVDVSFDLMLREIAPLPSLVQSLGRVNRNGEYQHSKFIITGFYSENEGVRNFDHLPYFKEEIQYVAQNLASLIQGGKTTKVEFENAVKDEAGKVSETRYLQEKEFIEYIVNLANKIIWSTNSVSDLLGDSLRETIPRKSIFVVKDREKAEIEKQLKNLREELKKDFKKEKFEEYIRLLTSYQGMFISVYEYETDKDSIKYDSYAEKYLGEK